MCTYTVYTYTVFFRCFSLLIVFFLFLYRCFTSVQKMCQQNTVTAISSMILSAKSHYSQVNFNFEHFFLYPSNLSIFFFFFVDLIFLQINCCYVFFCSSLFSVSFEIFHCRKKRYLEKKFKLFFCRTCPPR